eukprot:g4124.t1
MDEHRLRLRYENGLSTALGENAVRRVNKRIRQLILCNSHQEKQESIHALQRDLSTVRDMVLVQQLRHKKFKKLNLTETTEALNQQQSRLETELKEKSELHEKVAGDVPKSGTKADSGRSMLRPVSVCEAEVREIEKLEADLNKRIQCQEQDLLKWKELASHVQELLNSTGEEPESGLIESGIEELEPKIKKIRRNS